MNRYIIFLAASLILVGCNNKDKEEAENAKALAAATHEELVQAVQERDNLLDLINEITTTTNQIKEMEQIASINIGTGENGNNNAQVINNLEAIKATLADRKQKIEQLESQIKNSKTSNSKLQSALDNLKAQIASQATEIESLTQRLNTANAEIATLRTTADSLGTQVKTVTTERDSVQSVVQEQDIQLNACYYVIGSKKELKDHNIIEGGGFLSKTQVMPGNFDKNYFTMADKRTLRSIPLHSTKAKVLTKYQPSGSYEIVDVNGQKVLNILDPNAFWSISNYLVVQID